MVRPASGGGSRWPGWRTPAAYLGAAVLILNHLGTHVPYYFLDQGAIGTSAVIGNVGLLSPGFLELGYSLFGVARLVGKSKLRV